MKSALLATVSLCDSFLVPKIDVPEAKTQPSKKMRKGNGQINLKQNIHKQIQQRKAEMEQNLFQEVQPIIDSNPKLTAADTIKIVDQVLDSTPFTTIGESDLTNMSNANRIALDKNLNQVEDVVDDLEKSVEKHLENGVSPSRFGEDGSSPSKYDPNTKEKHNHGVTKTHEYSPEYRLFLQQHAVNSHYLDNHLKKKNNKYGMKMAVEQPVKSVGTVVDDIARADERTAKRDRVGGWTPAVQIGFMPPAADALPYGLDAVPMAFKNNLALSKKRKELRLQRLNQVMDKMRKDTSKTESETEEEEEEDATTEEVAPQITHASQSSASSPISKFTAFGPSKNKKKPKVEMRKSNEHEDIETIRDEFIKNGVEAQTKQVDEEVETPATHMDKVISDATDFFMSGEQMDDAKLTQLAAQFTEEKHESAVPVDEKQEAESEEVGESKFMEDFVAEPLSMAKRVDTGAGATFFAVGEEGVGIRFPLNRTFKVRQRPEGTSRLYPMYHRYSMSLRRNNGHHDYNHYNDTTDLPEPTRVKLFSYHELTYTGPFFVGAPGSNKLDHLNSMVYDTGSELCWGFDGSEKVMCCPNAQCDPMSKRLTGCANPSSRWSLFSKSETGNRWCPTSFSPFKHGTPESEFVVCYGRGFAKGQMSKSLISFSKQQKGVMFPFGIAKQTSDVLHDFGGCNGLVGLGPKDSKEHPSVVAAIHREGIIAEPMFSFNLLENDAAEFVLGGLDPRIVKSRDEMHWVPARRDQQYSLWWTLDATVHSGNMREGTPVVLDSGTTAVMIPKRHFTTFVAHVANDFGFSHKDRFLLGDPKGFIHFLDCKHPTIAKKVKYGGHQLQFNIGGVKYALDPSDYIVQLKDHSGQCFFGVAYLEGDEGVAILGDVFLRKYYTAFNYNHNGQVMVGIQKPDAAMRSMARWKMQRAARAQYHRQQSDMPMGEQPSATVIDIDQDTASYQQKRQFIQPTIRPPFHQRMRQAFQKNANSPSKPSVLSKLLGVFKRK